MSALGHKRTFALQWDTQKRTLERLVAGATDSNGRIGLVLHLITQPTNIVELVLFGVRLRMCLSFQPLLTSSSPNISNGEDCGTHESDNKQRDSRIRGHGTPSVLQARDSS